jgi:hypothetical protein
LLEELDELEGLRMLVGGYSTLTAPKINAGDYKGVGNYFCSPHGVGGLFFICLRLKTFVSLSNILHADK